MFLENSSRNDISTEEVEAIIADAYAVYKHKEAELEEILEEKIIDDVPSFNKCMLFIVKKKLEVKYENLYDKTW